jgi:hypothetical protein
MQGAMMGGLGLLRIPEVQAELKMTQPQIAKLDDAQQTVRQAMQEAFQGGRQSMSPEELEKAMAKVQEIQLKAVSDILDQNQLKRFKQLELQRAGASALLQPAVAKELGLTDEQKAKLRELRQQQMNEMRSMFQNAGGMRNMTQEERQQRMKQMQDLRKKNDEAMLNVLTAEQKAKWTSMVGKPFKFPEMGPGVFGGRQRNRPGGGPGGPGGNPPAQ